MSYVFWFNVLFRLGYIYSCVHRLWVMYKPWTLVQPHSTPYLIIDHAPSNLVQPIRSDPWHTRLHGDRSRMPRLFAPRDLGRPG
jgi:hypothetical protein